MLQTNLASRPFYNERLVTAALMLLAVVVLGLAAFNVQQLVSLSSRRSALAAQIGRDEKTADAASHEATAVQHTVNQAALTALANEAREANNLIAERTFSWTIFLGLIEKTLPQDVHLVSVAPRVDDNQLWITMLVIAKRPEDLNAFMNALDATGSFFETTAREEDRTDDGMRRATMRARYVQPAAMGATPTTPVPGAAPAAKPRRGRP
jgi:hypothetical protein